MLKNRTLRPEWLMVAALATVLWTTGCNRKEPAEVASDPVAEQVEATPVMENGVQVINIEVTAEGYRPGQISLRKGVPARLIFTRTVDSECAKQVQIPDFGVEKTDLPMNEPRIVEFTPDKGGEFQFVCGMDMMKGTIVIAS